MAKISDLGGRPYTLSRSFAILLVVLATLVFDYHSILGVIGQSALSGTDPDAIFPESNSASGILG